MTQHFSASLQLAIIGNSMVSHRLGAAFLEPTDAQALQNPLISEEKCLSYPRIHLSGSFDLTKGEHLDDKNVKLSTYAVRVEGGAVWLGLVV